MSAAYRYPWLAYVASLPNKGMASTLEADEALAHIDRLEARLAELQATPTVTVHTSTIAPDLKPAPLRHLAMRLIADEATAYSLMVAMANGIAHGSELNDEANRRAQLFGDLWPATETQPRLTPRCAGYLSVLADVLAGHFAPHRPVPDPALPTDTTRPAP